MEKRREKTRYFLIYSLIVCALWAVMYIIFKSAGKSMIWDPDGTRQHYPALYYIGEYLKNGVKSLLGIECTAPSMVDYSLGQGLDVLTTLNYYGFGDPLTLLAVFVKQDAIDSLYTVLIFLRLYLSGIAFSCYCFTIQQKEKGAILTGAIAYTFCGMALFSSVRHPFFINAMIYLPLLLIGAERMLTKKKYGFFSCMVAVSLISNFYFAYMNTAFVGIYLLFRLFVMKKDTIKVQLIRIGKMCVAYLLGAGISAVVFLPVVYAFMQNARSKDVGGYTDSLFYYTLDYYKSFISNYTSPKLWVDSWMIGGLSSICLIAVFYLFFVYRKEESEKSVLRVVKGSYGVLLLFAMVPLFGKILNGFGYVCNRWNYAFALCNAMIVVFMLPKLIALSKKEWIRLATMIAAYIIIMLAASKFTTAFIYIGALGLIAMMAILYVVRKKGEVIAYRIVVGTVSAIIAVYMCVVYMPAFGNYVASFCEDGKILEFENDSAISAVAEIEDSGFYRVEQPWLMSNQAAVLGYYGNTFYWSVIPASITDLYDGIGMASLDRTYECNGLDARTIINELACTKYYVTDSKQTGLVPYGYEFLKSVEKDGATTNIYKNSYALSIGTSFSSYMRQSEYETLAPLQKQEALLSCVIVEDQDVTEQMLENEVSAEDLSLTTHEIESKISSMNGLTVEDGTINVEEPGATLTISFEGEENSETYLEFHNFEALSGADYEELSVTSGDTVSTTMFLYRERNAAHYEKEYNSVNLGSSEDAKSEVTITFPNTGSFSYDSFTMYSYSLNDYESNVSKLLEEPLENVTVGTDKVTGTVTTSKDQWMQFSIPYSTGWTAYVDGEKQTLAKTDTAYMGLYLSQGSHTIELRYETPYIRIGAVITIVSVLFLVCFTWIRKKRS